jgi:hypothetical protein
LPVISLVGYTNAGKSTLLNSLTDSAIVAEDKLFATLDPTSRRLRFPEEMEVIITDTVGFIRNLPEDLLQAFKATLEELARGGSAGPCHRFFQSRLPPADGGGAEAAPGVGARPFAVSPGVQQD